MRHDLNLSYCLFKISCFILNTELVPSLFTSINIIFLLKLNVSLKIKIVFSVPPSSSLSSLCLSLLGIIYAALLSLCEETAAPSWSAHSAVLVKMNMTAALNEPATGRVTIQAKMMFLQIADKSKMRNSEHCQNNGWSTYRNSFQSTPFSSEFIQPTNTTEPTLQWVVLIGKPIFEASNTVNAAPISMVKPLKQIDQKSLGSINFCCNLENCCRGANSIFFL